MKQVFDISWKIVFEELSVHVHLPSEKPALRVVSVPHVQRYRFLEIIIFLDGHSKT